MICSDCNGEKSFWETRTSRMYWCSNCRTVEPLSREGKSLGVFKN